MDRLTPLVLQIDLPGAVGILSALGAVAAAMVAAIAARIARDAAIATRDAAEANARMAAIMENQWRDDQRARELAEITRLRGLLYELLAECNDVVYNFESPSPSLQTLPVWLRVRGEVYTAFPEAAGEMTLAYIEIRTCNNEFTRRGKMSDVEIMTALNRLDSAKRRIQEESVQLLDRESALRDITDDPNAAHRALPPASSQ